MPLTSPTKPTKHPRRVYLTLAILITAITLILPLPAYSAGWYWDPDTGVDTNGGTSWADAVKTGMRLSAISNAGTMAAGDTIYVPRGKVSWNDSLRLYEGGTSTLPIVIFCVGDTTLNKFQLRGDKKQAWTSLGNNVWVAYVADAPGDSIKTVWFTDSTFVRYDLKMHRGIIATSPGAVNAQYEYHWKNTVDSLYIYLPAPTHPANYVTPAYRYYGLMAMSGGNVDYVRVENIEVCGQTGKCVFIGNTCDNWRMRWCEVHHNGPVTVDGRLAVYCEGSGNIFEYGYIYQAGGNGFESANSSNICQYTRLRDCNHHCIDTKGMNTIVGGTQSGNIFRWNRIWSEEITGTAVNGIYVGHLDNTHYAYGVQIYGNTLWNIAGNGIIAADNATAATGNIIIANNSIHNSSANNIYIDLGDSTVTLINNNCWAPGGTPYGRQLYLTSRKGKTINYNNWYTVANGQVWCAFDSSGTSLTWDGTQWTTWQGFGFDTNSVRVLPGFTNDATGDLTTTSTSAVIGLGTSARTPMTYDFHGDPILWWKPCTIGADQIPYRREYRLR